MHDYLILIAGVVAAALGGELFVKGVVGVAKWARISPGIIGATFAAFATSSPELSVSVTSALAGTPQIALGDAIGSNIVNVALILGIALLFSRVNFPRDALQRDFPVAVLVPVMLAIFTYDGNLSRLDGLLLLALFVTWLTVVVVEVRRQRSAAVQVLAAQNLTRAMLEGVGGLALLIISGRLIVSGATGVAASYGIEPYVVGATIVALGTSAPELATVVIAKIRGHDEVGLGTILGSNIFNGIFIVPVASLIHPIVVDRSEVSIGLAFGIVTIMCMFTQNPQLERRRGVLLVAMYISYLVVMMQAR